MTFHVHNQIQNYFSQVWWHTPIITAISEAEAEELHVPGQSEQTGGKLFQNKT